MDSFMILNRDALGVILNSVCLSKFLSFASVSKMFRDIIRLYTKKLRIHLSKDIKLRPMQGVLRNDFASFSGTFSFRAPKDFGKTIAGYACCTKASVIRASSNGLKVWIQEAKNLGWYHPDPNYSKIVCYHSVNSKHRDYLRTFPNTRKEVIIITTDKNLLSSIMILQRLKPTLEKTLIIDEAHRPSNFLCTAMGYCKSEGGSVIDRQLLLSAEAIPSSTKIKIKKYIKVSKPEPVPEVMWNFITLYEDSGSWILEDKKTKAIRKYIKRHRKTLIFATKDEIERFIKADIFDRITLFVQKTGVTTITKFNDYEGKQRAVILINTAQVESINVYADGVIIYGAGRMNIQHDTQAIGRTLRSKNETNIVSVYLFCFNDKQLMRSACKRCFSSEKWKFLYEGLPTESFLKKAGALVRMIGSSILDVTREDGCLLFHDYSKFPISEDTLVKWWQENAVGTNLTEEIIRTL